jgi:hypothetical protein
VLTIGSQRLRATAEGPRHPGDGQIENYSLSFYVTSQSNVFLYRLKPI